MQRIPNSASDGFTLLETVVATGILVTALAGIAQLFALSVRSTHAAGSDGAALTAAQDKIEWLRSLDFGYGPVGEPVTDPELTWAGGGSLDEDIPGLVDELDSSGAVVDVARDEHGAAFTRRWRLTRIDRYLPEAVAIEVCVWRWTADIKSPRTADVCLATVRGRQP